MRSFITSLAIWLAKYGSNNIYLIHVDTALLESARTRVINADKMVSASGENKRHHVYAQLLREFPDASGNNVALAIELAVRSVS